MKENHEPCDVFAEIIFSLEDSQVHSVKHEVAYNACEKVHKQVKHETQEGNDLSGV